MPIYSEGTDPASRNPEIIGQVCPKRGLLPLKARLVRPFAYRLSGDGVRRVWKTLKEGDTVVITQEPGPVISEEIYAVRHGDKVILSKVLEKGTALLLLSDEGQAHIEMLPAPRQGGIHTLLAGRVVASIRPPLLTPAELPG